MPNAHELQAYAYVNRPYSAVRDLLRRDPNGVFRTATTSAASRANELAADLRVDIAGVEMGAEVTIHVEKIEETTGGRAGPATHLRLRWSASNKASLFPTMDADLAIYPLTSTETQLDLHGHYTPPLNLVGDVLDALIGHRIARASVHRFINEVAEHLKA